MQVAATVAPYAPLAGRVDAAFYARGGYVYFSTREDGRVVVGGFRDVTPGMVRAVCAGGILTSWVGFYRLLAAACNAQAVPPSRSCMHARMVDMA